MNASATDGHRKHVIVAVSRTALTTAPLIALAPVFAPLTIAACLTERVTRWWDQ